MTIDELEGRRIWHTTGVVGPNVNQSRRTVEISPEERDDIVRALRALEEIYDMKEPQWEIGSARHVALKVLGLFK